MQLNLFTILNSFCELTVKTNHSFFSLNHNLLGDILESQMALVTNTLTASSSILTRRPPNGQNFELVGSLNKELLESGRESLETTIAHLNQARPGYEQLAIDSAASYGEMMHRMTNSNRP